MSGGNPEPVYFFALDFFLPGRQEFGSVSQAPINITISPPSRVDRGDYHLHLVFMAIIFRTCHSFGVQVPPLSVS